MATAVRTDEITKTLAGAWPTLESVEGAIRTARGAVDEARNLSEAVVTATVRQVRQRPLVAVGLAATAGLLTGCALAAAAWMLERRVWRGRRIIWTS